ncbi:unnamed protein product, partial [Anisakis simplex]|uniref:F-box protein n=1 Tax=Anisakis simplex TaxID=6269 RepID=A0A0M3JH89_ANISI
CTLYPGAPVISTNVESESCWQQAIYPVEEPFSVSDGDQCVVAIDAFRNRFCCQLKRCDEDKLLSAAVDSVEDEWEMLPEKCEKSCSTIEKPFNGNEDDEEMDLNEWERASKQTSSGVKCVAVIDSIAANGDMRIITLNTTNSQVNDVAEMEVDDEFLKIKKSD